VGGGGRAPGAATPVGGAAPEGTEANQEMERLLREIARCVRRQGRRALGAMGITGPQFDALNQLRCSAMTMGELCERLEVASSTLTDLVDRMERAGLVRRCRVETDKRVVRLHISDRGRAVIENVLEVRAAYVGTVLERLPADRRAGVEEAVRLLHVEVTRPEGT
jgi:DNA-binding MarR family transcriptional regulator